ncbi:MAG: hypothetical protein GC183_11710 [Thiobacillus sp.]|nr:hypothetical protein [Thiobacillus sp.]
MTQKSIVADAAFPGLGGAQESLLLASGVRRAGQFTAASQPLHTDISVRTLAVLAGFSCATIEQPDRTRRDFFMRGKGRHQTGRIEKVRLHTGYMKPSKAKRPPVKVA